MPGQKCQQLTLEREQRVLCDRRSSARSQQSTFCFLWIGDVVMATHQTRRSTFGCQFLPRLLSHHLADQAPAVVAVARVGTATGSPPAFLFLTHASTLKTGLFAEQRAHIMLRSEMSQQEHERATGTGRRRRRLVELYDAACSHSLLCLFLCSLFRRNFLLNVESEEDRGDEQ